MKEAKNANHRFHDGYNLKKGAFPPARSALSTAVPCDFDGGQFTGRSLPHSQGGKTGGREVPHSGRGRTASGMRDDEERGTLLPNQDTGGNRISESRQRRRRCGDRLMLREELTDRTGAVFLMRMKTGAPGRGSFANFTARAGQFRTRGGKPFIPGGMLMAALSGVGMPAARRGMRTSGTGPRQSPRESGGVPPGMMTMATGGAVWFSPVVMEQPRRRGCQQIAGDHQAAHQGISIAGKHAKSRQITAFLLTPETR